MAADKTSVVSRDKTSVAVAEKTSSSILWGARSAYPRGGVDFTEMSGDVSAAAAAATDILALDTTDVLSAARADDHPREVEGRA